MGAQQRGGDEWERALDGKQRALERETWKAVQAAAHLIEREIKATLRTYTHPEGTPTTSPPGEPPALVNGNLRRSVRVRGPRVGRKPDQVIAQIGPTAVYSRIQELGGKTGRKHRTTLPARPYVRPTVRRLRRDIRAVYRRHWTKALLS